MDEPAAKPPLYGKNTEAALGNFQISGRPVPRRLLRALAQVKAAAAVANAGLADRSGVDEAMGAAIAAAADEVIAGRWDDQFPVDVFQTGSGTSTNMNMNEVLATLAADRLGRPVHPNDHVNASQSTNDVFPTAIRVAALDLVIGGLIPSLRRLERELADKAAELDSVVKAGRTHLMDATPVTLGQEFAGYRVQVAEAIARIESSLPRVAALPLGGTATGTGLNAPEGYATAAVAELGRRTGLALAEARDHFAVQGSQDALVELSGQLRGTAITLFKIANDVRWLASGPRTGLAEIRLAELQPGSSIMPGKVNPVICEVVLQVAAQVIGNDMSISFAGTQGNLELNVFLPLIARNLLESAALLATASASLADRCIASLTADEDRCRSYAELTPALATALNPVIGYDAAVRLVRVAAETGRTILETVVDEGLLDEEAAMRVLDVAAMAQGARSPTPDPPPGESGVASTT